MGPLARNSKAPIILLIHPKCTWNNDDFSSNKNTTDQLVVFTKRHKGGKRTETWQ